VNYFVVSDLHIGFGPLADFTNDHDLVRFLDSRTRGDHVVFNGDAFDFAQTPASRSEEVPSPSVEGNPTLGATEEESRRKLQLIVEGHPELFDAMREMTLNRGVRITFVAGNHDVDLLWPGVTDDLARACGTGGIPGTVSRDLRLDSKKHADVIVFHGHQHAGPANRFDRWDDGPFLTSRDGVRHLEQPWGARLMTSLMNPVDLHFPFVDNIRPLSRLAVACRRTNKRYLAILRELITSQLGDVLAIDSDSQLPIDDARKLRVYGGLENEEAIAWLGTVAVDGGTELDAGLLVHRDARSSVLMDIHGRESKELARHAESLLRRGYSLVICGHTHERIPIGLGRAQYINTGTWIPYMKPGVDNILPTGEIERYRRHDPELFDVSLTYATFEHDAVEGLIGEACLEPWPLTSGC